MEPNPPSWGRSWAQDKSNRADRSAVFREHSKWWTKIDTRLTCVSGEEGHINIFIGWLDFLVFFLGQSYLATLVTPQIAQSA